MSANHPVILFDGVCNLCHGAVFFIIHRDRNARFRFAALQSDAGRRLLGVAVASGDPDSIILLEDGLRYDQSTAALRIARQLDGLWPVLYVFVLLPRPIRDAIYRWIARHRYHWFGRQDRCLVPTPEVKSRFLA